MNNKNYPNLKSWQRGQSGNPAGRKPGSKNISTIVQELLDYEADEDFLARSTIAEFVKDMPTSYAKAVVWVTIQKALQGDMRAIIWLAELQERNSVQLNVIRQEPLIVSRIKPRFPPTVD